MTEDSYLRWLANETPTRWWHDSAEPAELAAGLAHGAVGATTNPVLAATTLQANHDYWRPRLRSLPHDIPAGQRAESAMRVVVTNAAAMFEPAHTLTEGRHGYACAQVVPSAAGDREAMWEMARRFHAWAPNIAVKLPATAAGLDVLEECAANGMTVVATVSFTVPQVLAVAERYQRGLRRARAAGKTPGRCFAVIMIGRLDDYLADVASDNQSALSAADLKQAGLAVAKRAYAIYQERGYEATLMVAALRGAYHATELAGADIVLSIHPTYQALLLQPGVERDAHAFDRPVEPDVIARLSALHEFTRAYEPAGMTPEEFITYGLVQRTLAQFQASWAQLPALAFEKE